MKVIASLVLAVVLAGCKQQAAPVAAPQPQANAVNTVQVATPAETAAMKLALDAEGLRLFNTVSGASRLIPFGTGREEAQRAFAAAVKAQPLEQEEISDCGAAFARWPGGLVTWFADGKFTGWSAGADSTGLATASGLRPGSTRAELDAAYSAKIVPSTLGVEFSAGALGGMLDSRRPNAKVTHLWAGTTCLAR
jgi:hypothetical protein